MEVAVGGTFDPVHAGHRALFECAFELGDVTVGLTSDDLAVETRTEERPVRQYAERKRDLEGVLADIATEYVREYIIRELTEPTGIATEAQFDALVVTPKTKLGAMRVNEIRREKDREPPPSRSSITFTRQTAISSPAPEL
jgi:pantetheine-phosphate adenylyltransferase